MTDSSASIAGARCPLFLVCVVGVAIAAFLLMSATLAVAQPERKPVRAPVVDLEADAKKPRPGQVVPEGTPEATSTPAEATPAAPAAPPAGAQPPPAVPTSQLPVIPAPVPTSAKSSAPSAAGTPVPGSSVKGDVAASTLPAPIQSVGVRFVATDRVRAMAVSTPTESIDAQWRTVDGLSAPTELALAAWKTPAADHALTGIIEVRTGPAPAAVVLTIRVEDAGILSFGPLTRAKIERRVRSDGVSIPSLRLVRGSVRLEPDPAASEGRVMSLSTPDSSFDLSEGTVAYDVLTGTTVSRRPSQPSK